MHEMALLRAEVQDLRQANETLSRRRRAKRTRLQKGGAMTVEEGRRAIDQIFCGIFIAISIFKVKIFVPLACLCHMLIMYVNHTIHN